MLHLRDHTPIVFPYVDYWKTHCCVYQNSYLALKTWGGFCKSKTPDSLLCSLPLDHIGPHIACGKKVHYYKIWEREPWKYVKEQISLRKVPHLRDCSPLTFTYVDSPNTHVCYNPLIVPLGVYCGNKKDASWQCTLPFGHKGNHIACEACGGHYLEEWEQKTYPEKESMPSIRRAFHLRDDSIIESNIPQNKIYTTSCQGDCYTKFNSLSNFCHYLWEANGQSWCCTLPPKHLGNHIACRHNEHNIKVLIKL